MRIVQKDLSQKGFAVLKNGDVIPLFSENLGAEANAYNAKLQDIWGFEVLFSNSVKYVLEATFPANQKRIEHLSNGKLCFDMLTEIRTGLPGVYQFGVNQYPSCRGYI